MLTLAVNIAIIQAGQILLIKREDFEVWCLPGGHVDIGESIAQAALRETREETGLDVELTRLVGIYSIPGKNASGSHVVLFAAKPIGGELKWSEDEVLEARYYDPHLLPEPLLWLHRQRITDALDGFGGSVSRLQRVNWPFAPNVTREKLYQLRDQSGLSRQAFFLRYFDQNRPEDGTLEVG